MRSVFYFYIMQSFILDVLQDLKSNDENLSTCTFILPSKRAGLFLKNEIIKQANSPGFLPEIISIEVFIEELSQLKLVNNIEALFEFYSVYKDLTKKNDLQTFDRFSTWAPVVIQDFNEIDRHLVKPKKIFQYLSAIQEINHWSLSTDPTDMMKKYLSFWKDLNKYYDKFSKRLLKSNIGYQGLIYKTAVQNLEAYLQYTKRGKHIFLGFNALNSSESLIIQELLQQDRAYIFWDTDATFINSSYHDAGLFLRDYKQKWVYYKSHSFNWLNNNYKKPKNISITGAPKQIGQAKYVGELLCELFHENKLESTALVLADETLLLPILNSLPKAIDTINITMGLPLAQTPLKSLVDQWFKLSYGKTKTFYYKDVINLLTHPFIVALFSHDSVNVAHNITKKIKAQNLTNISLFDLLKISKGCETEIELIFGGCIDSPKMATEHLINILFVLKEKYEMNRLKNVLALEYLQRFLELFRQIQYYVTNYNAICSIKTLHTVFKELLANETLSFKGHPLKGLQIMGMLESRVLDFETIIVVSVNEGILPAGKTQNSFIPFDVKLENQLPTHKEKDAIYTYHFYRLLQRSKNIHLIYNTEPDVLKGGEPSRFIAQLELENIHHFNHQILTPMITSLDNSLTSVKKTEDILEKLRFLAHNGLSPSSLGQYIRNPIDFYNHKILGLEEGNEVEETIKANTFGTVVHNSLEAIYKPFVGDFLEVKKLEAAKSLIDSTVLENFTKIYKKGNIKRGKNLISFEIAKRHIYNFINHEIKDLKQGRKIKIEALEKSVNISVKYPEFNHSICLKGNIDRVDLCDGSRRIIDYKTSKVTQTDLNLVDWNQITKDYKAHSKSFQVLMYTYILNQADNNLSPFEAGIISFKNLKAGVLKFTKKDKAGRGAMKQTQITKEFLDFFEIQLKALLLELFDIEKEFIEKEI